MINNKQLLKSPIYRTGSKSKVLKKIIPLFPSGIECFYDLFGGSGVVVMNVDSCSKVYNEIDSNTFGIVEYLKFNNENDIINSYNEHKLKYYRDDPKEFFLKTKEVYNARSEINLLWYASFMAFSNKLSFNKKGQLNSSFGKRLSEEKLKHINNFDDIKITNDDYRIHLFTDFHENDFVFLDPPYFLSEISNRSYVKTWTGSDEERLLKFITILYDNDVKFGLTNLVEYKGKKHVDLLELIEELSLNYIVLSTTNNANGTINDNYLEYYIYNYELE